MIHKIELAMQSLFIFLSIHWQPVLGAAMSVVGTVYYLSVLKVNVVDVKFNGSWKRYFKSLLKGL